MCARANSNKTHVDFALQQAKQTIYAYNKSGGEGSTKGCSGASGNMELIHNRYTLLANHRERHNNKQERKSTASVEECDGTVMHNRRWGEAADRSKHYYRAR